MSERRLFGAIIVNNDENKVELSEKVQWTLCVIEKIRTKALLLIYEPIIIIPIRIAWLTILMFIAILADYGAYYAIPALQSGIHTAEEWENINRTIFIIEHIAWWIPIFVYYSILSTMYDTLNDIFKSK